MATRVLSIEIGQGLTHVVEMDYKAKNPKIYNCFTFETPQGVIKDGIVHRTETFSSLMANELSKRDIKTKKAVFVVASSRIAIREAMVPLVKEKQLAAVVNASASDYFPVDMNQFHLCYRIMDKIQDTKQYRLNLIAVPNDLTASYFDLAASISVELVALDYVGNSVYEVFGSALQSGTNVIVKVEEDNSLILVLQDGKIMLQRTVQYGIDEAINAVRTRDVFGENLTYQNAIDVLSGRTVIRRYLSTEADYKEEEDTSKDVEEARRSVTESLRYMISSVGRVLEYYTSRNEGVQIEEVALTGLGADFSGLSKLMSNELNQNVKVFHDVENVSISKNIGEQIVYLNAYAACIGAGLNPLNLIPETDKKAKAKEGKSTSADRWFLGGLVVLLLGVAGAAGLYVYSSNQVNEVQSKIDKVNANITRMRNAGVEEVYNEYTTVGNLNNQLNTIYDSSLSRSEDLVAFIEELEAKLPSELIVLNFTATRSGVSMSMECESKEAAAKTLMQLRTFDSIQVVSSNGLNDANSLAEQEGASVTFSVECTYKPVEKEAE